MSDQIASLFASLGLELNTDEWNVGSAAIKKQVAQLRAMAVESRIAGKASTDVGLALSTIGLPVAKSTTLMDRLAGTWESGREKILALGKYAAIGFGLLTAGVGAALHSTIDLGGHLADLSQKVGLDAESLQEYGYAAKLGGSSMDGFADGVRHFAKTLDGARTGSKEAVAALSSVGLTGASLTSALKGGSGLDTALMGIADHFKELPDGPKKTALAMQLFGKSGAELIPTLNLGRAGLAQLREEAKRTGAVLSNASVEALDPLGDNIDKLKMSLGGLKNQAIAALVPALSELVSGALAWIQANREIIDSGIRSAVEAITIVFRGLALALSAGVEVLQFFGEHMNVTKAIVGALGIAFAVMGLEAAAAWIAATAPILALGAGVAAVILFVEDLWDGITEGKGVTAAVVRAAIGVFRTFGRAISDVFAGIRDFFVDTAIAVRDAFVSAFEWIAAKIDWVWGKIGEASAWLNDHTFGIVGSPGAPAQDPSARPAVAGTAITRSANAGAPVVQRTTTNNLTINATGTDPKALVDEIERRQGQMLRDADAATGGDEP